MLDVFRRSVLPFFYFSYEPADSEFSIGGLRRKTFDNFFFFFPSANCKPYSNERAKFWEVSVAANFEQTSRNSQRDMRKTTAEIQRGTIPGSFPKCYTRVSVLCGDRWFVREVSECKISE